MMIISRFSPFQTQDEDTRGCGQKVLEECCCSLLGQNNNAHETPSIVREVLIFDLILDTILQIRANLHPSRRHVNRYPAHKYQII